MSDPLPFLMYAGLAALLLLLNGYFVAVEFAIVKVKSSRLEAFASEGRFRARFVQQIARNMNAYLAACRLGIVMATLTLGWIGEKLVSHFIAPLLVPLLLPAFLTNLISFAIAFSFITLMHMTLGEQLPKSYAIRRSEQVALLASGPLVLFYRCMLPFVWVINAVSNRIPGMAGLEAMREQISAHSEEDIRVLMKESNKRGLIDNTELALMDNIFDFTETMAREIMIPRTEMVCLYAEQPFEHNKAIAVSEMHTRYPVCSPDKDGIIGFVHIKDLLKSSEQIDGIQSIVRPIMKVPESMQISVLLKLMQRRKMQMALLIDEYGGTSGLVTFEDIIEEIVGEVQDEFDEERPQIEKNPDGTYSIDGRLLIEEVNSYFGLRIESDDYDTIGGWIYSQVEIPPKRHERIVWSEACEFIIDEMDHLRISRIKVIRKQHESRQHP